MFNCSCTFFVSLRRFRSDGNNGSRSSSRKHYCGAGSRSTGWRQVVRVAAVDPQVALDPQQYTYSIVMKITDNVTESLITTMEDGSLEPNLLTALRRYPRTA